MKRTLAALLLAMVVPALCLGAGHKVKKPSSVGKNGTRIVYFCGGRPWQATEDVKQLVSGGMRVLQLDGRYLDGHGGSPIRVHMADSHEPDPFDGITPTFKSLSTYKLLVFNRIPREELAQILTPERLAALKKYVENGGHVLFSRSMPESVGELAPVLPTDDGYCSDKGMASRPSGKLWKPFPEKFPVPGYDIVQLAPGAVAVSKIDDCDDTPFIARKRIGKGTVTYFNAEILKDVDNSALYQFSGWGAANAFAVAICADSGEFDADAGRFIEKLPPIPARKQLGDVSVKIGEPELGIAVSDAAPTVSGNSAIFPNGCKIVASDSGKVSVIWPDGRFAMRDFAMPLVQCSSTGVGYDNATAEAAASKEKIKSVNIQWKYSGLRADGGKAVLVYTAPGAEMLWEFAAGSLELDGRRFLGVSDSVRITKCNAMIGGIEINGSLIPEHPLVARRFSCYYPPRGYTAFDMSGKVNADTQCWNFFGSGQPFEMLVCADGVYLGMVDGITSVSAQMTAEKGKSAIGNHRVMHLGRVKAPVATSPYWHWFSQGAEREHNDYMAAYQFVRKNLRRHAGLDDISHYPTADVNYFPSSRRAEFNAWVKKAGYRYMRVSVHETPNSALCSPDSIKKLFKPIVANGFKPYTWSAGSYVQANTSWEYKNHPEWFVRDENGKIFCYGGQTYPVIDINNEEYFKWYKQAITRLVKEGGLGAIYRDMDGTASLCVNYATPESPNGLKAQARVYRFLEDQGCLVAIEGQNPLVLDQYWYRAHLYSGTFPGNEFVLVGSAPSADLFGGVELDIFRTAMYNCFPEFDLGPVMMEVDKIPGLVERGQRATSFVKKFNETLDHTGTPFVRETEFGTSWVGPKGGALFFWNPAKKVTVDLPAGWRIKGVSGNVLKNVKGDSVFLLEKK
ncbi:MAG: hypothetical protein MJ025_02045 [Victivallaceae bacterium]|nr:hypothetical protein [Victivallaceae bacterium]